MSEKSLTVNEIKFLSAIGLEVLLKSYAIYTCGWTSHKGVMHYIKEDDKNFLSVVLSQLNGSDHAYEILHKLFMDKDVINLIQKQGMLFAS